MAGVFMHIEIVPFGDAHLEEAAELLATRHQGDYALEPALPERFKQPVVARAAVEATWSKPDASGVVALYADRMIGYLSCTCQPPLRLIICWFQSSAPSLLLQRREKRNKDEALVVPSLPVDLPQTTPLAIPIASLIGA